MLLRMATDTETGTELDPAESWILGDVFRDL